jgi:MFS family permease
MPDSPAAHIPLNAWKTLLIIAGTITIFLYLNTGIAPALPSIAQYFQISLALSSWVLAAYMVCGAVMTVIMGRLSDLFGAKKMLMVMMTCFTAGTILAPFSPNISTLLALRVLQGIAVASTPISTKLIRDQLPMSKFPIGISIYLAAYSGGMALGAVLGPIVVAGTGWQGNFYLCAPIAVVLSFASWRFVHVDENNKIHGHDYVDKKVSSYISIDAKKLDEKQRIDFIGIITMAVTLVSFLIAITFSGTIATNLVGFLVPLVMGVIFLVLFIFVEKRVKSPLVNLKLAFHPVIFTGNIIMLMVGILQYIVIISIPQLGSAYSIGVRIRPTKSRVFTTAFWSINDDLWASFRIASSKKKEA